MSIYKVGRRLCFIILTIVFRENAITHLNCRSLLSYVTTQEEYKYEDLEEGIVLVERRHCVSPFA